MELVCVEKTDKLIGIGRDGKGGWEKSKEKKKEKKEQKSNGTKKKTHLLHN